MVVVYTSKQTKKFRRARNLLLSQSGPPKSNVAFLITVSKKSVAHLLAVAPNVAAIVYLLLRRPRKLTGLKRKKQTNQHLTFITACF